MGARELYGHAHDGDGNYPLAVAAFERAENCRLLGNPSRIALAPSHARLGQIDQSRRLLIDLLHDDSLSAGRFICVAMGPNAVDQVN